MTTLTMQRGAVWAVSIFLLLSACGKKDTPEAQVRAALARAEEAAEKRDVAELRGLVSEKYTDAQGHDKRAVEGVLRFYFLRNEKVSLFTHIRSVTVTDGGRVQAIVLVAMAAQPVKTAEELQSVRADLYRFDVMFAREEKRWRVVGAEWRPAQVIEFL